MVSSMYVLLFVRVCACLRRLYEQLWALCMNSSSHGQSEGGPQGKEAMGEGTDARQTRHLPLPFHLPLPASNNKLFHSGIFAASHPQTLEAPTRSRCLIQCSEKNSWFESDFFYPRPFPYLPLRFIAPLPVLPNSVFFLSHQNIFCAVNTKVKPRSVVSGLHSHGK